MIKVKEEDAPKDSVKTEEKQIKKVIEKVQEKPQQAQDRIDEVKKLIDEVKKLIKENKTGELNQAVEKMIQAKAIVKKAGEDIKNVENEIDKKIQQADQDKKDTENAPASIEESNNSGTTSTTTDQLIKDPAKSTQSDQEEDLS